MLWFYRNDSSICWIYRKSTTGSKSQPLCCSCSSCLCGQHPRRTFTSVSYHHHYLISSSLFNISPLFNIAIIYFLQTQLFFHQVGKTGFGFYLVSYRRWRSYFAKDRRRVSSLVLFRLISHELKKKKKKIFSQRICHEDSIECNKILLESAMGPSVNTNISRVPYYLRFEPHPTSVKNLIHWSQNVRDNQ